MKVHTMVTDLIAFSNNNYTVSQWTHIVGVRNTLTDKIYIYINGILQANGINFTEIVDDTDATKGVGVNFTPEELIAGDVVVLEWVVNNANF